MANYDIGKKSDMKKFQKDLESQVKNIAKESLHKRKYDVECPHCKSKISAPSGKSLCPMCKKTVDLSLDINF